MAYGLIWAPTAWFDLKNLADYIAEDNPATAQRFVRSIFQLLERLPRFPESGRFVPEFNDAQIREVLRNPVESCTGSSPKNKSLRLPESGMQPEAF